MRFKLPSLFRSMIASGLAHVGLIGLFLASTVTALEPASVLEVSVFEKSTKPMAAPLRAAARPRTAKNHGEAQNDKPEPTISQEPPPSSVDAQGPDSTSSTPTRPGDFDPYLRQIHQTLNRRKVYPDLARRLRQQARVLVQLRISRTGRILSSKIVEKSPFESLNQAAQKLIQDIGSFDPFPQQVAEAAWDITVPIEYKM